MDVEDISLPGEIAVTIKEDGELKKIPLGYCEDIRLDHLKKLHELLWYKNDRGEFTKFNHDICQEKLTKFLDELFQ